MIYFLTKHPTTHRPCTGVMRYYGLVCMALFVLNLVLFWPGLRSSDSYLQWKQGTTHTISNAHPPLMAWWWNWLGEHVYADMSVLLVFHLGVFWLAIYISGLLIGRRSPGAAYCLFLVWLCPCVMSMTGVLWKDSGMAFCYLLACALMLRASMQGYAMGAGSLVIVLLCLFYGTAVRHNAVTALPPLCAWLALCIIPARHSRTQLWGTTIVLFTGLMTAIYVTGVIITTHPVDLAQGTILLHLAMMSYNVGYNLFPDYVLHDAGLTYDEFIQNSGFYYRHMHVHLARLQTADPAKIAELKSMFFHAVAAHPWTYVHYRIMVFLNLLGLTSDPIFLPYQPIPDSAPAYTQWAGAYFAATNLLFQPWLWCLLCIALGVMARRRMQRNAPFGREILCMMLSALCYIPPYLLIASSTDFRYIYWTVVAGLFSGVLWISTLDINSIRRQYLRRR